MHTRHHRHLARGTLAGLIGTVGMGIVNFFLRRHWALTLEQADFGWFYVNYTLFFIAAFVIDLGGANYSTIAIAKHDESGDHETANHIFFSISLYKMLSGLVGTVVVWLLAPWLAVRLQHEGSVGAIRLMAFFFPLFCLEGHLFAVLCSFKAFAVGYGMLLLKFILILLAAMRLPPLIHIPPLLFIGGSALTCVLAIGYLVGSGKVQVHARFCSLHGIGKYLVKGIWLALFNVSAQTVLYVDIMVAALLLGVTVMAVYNVAVPIVQILYSLLVIVPTVGTPVIAAMWEKDNAEPVVAELCSTFLIAMVGLLWCALLVTVPFGNLLIVLLFSAQFVEAGVLLPYLASGIILYIVAFSFLSAWNARGKNHTTSLIMLFGPVLNIVLCLVLIPRLGLRGAAVAVFCAHATTCLAACALLKAKMPSFKLAPLRLFYLSACGLVLLAPARHAGPVESIMTRQSALAAGAIMLYLVLAAPAILPRLRALAGQGALRHPSA
ncbi:MAG: polysaccharide biosynthesis C-terminal domain-containing protein [Kiritimatiellae bacterium]|nr:polysaccharide biosynthesis C-terminal domain-containing protein [Kiritimatiellia bacterium]